jgi:hypothetical protein
LTTPIETDNEYGLFWWLETLSGSQAFAAEGQAGGSSWWCLNSDGDHRNHDADMWLSADDIIYMINTTITRLPRGAAESAAPSAMP